MTKAESKKINARPAARIVETTEHGFSLTLGKPLIFKLLIYLKFGPLPAGQEVALHPLAFAGWVGIFITALNLIPIDRRTFFQSAGVGLAAVGRWGLAPLAAILPDRACDQR